MIHTYDSHENDDDIESNKIFVHNVLYDIIFVFLTSLVFLFFFYFLNDDETTRAIICSDLVKPF